MAGLAISLTACAFNLAPAPIWTHGDRTRAVVALTFDDGPNGRCTEGVLDALAATGTPAAFFLVGSFVDRAIDDALLARMVREGHTLGVHGYWHNAIRRTFFSDLTADDLRTTANSISHALDRGSQPTPPIGYYRPPYGFYTTASRRGVARAGFRLVTWAVSVNDWPSWRQADDIVAPIMARVHAGDVIVLHDGTESGGNSQRTCLDHPALAEAIRRLIPALHAAGLTPVPLATLLADPPPPPRPGGG